MRTVVFSLLVLSMASPALAQATPEYHLVVGGRTPVTDQPPPAGFHRERRFDWAMFAAGLGTFAVGYGVSAALGPTILAEKGGSVMAIPVVGPFLMMPNVQLAGAGCDATKMCLDSQTRTNMMSALGTSAGLQLVGLGMFMTSFFTGRTVVVRDSQPLVSNVHVTPVVSGRFSGVTLSGAF